MKRQPNWCASCLPSILAEIFSQCVFLIVVRGEMKGVGVGAWQTRGSLLPSLGVLRTFCAHLTLVLQIALVAHDDDGEVVLVLDPQYLLLECDNLFKRLARRYAVDEQEALARPHVLLAHRRVLLLAGGVEHIEQRDLIVDDALLAVGVCEMGRWVSVG